MGASARKKSSSTALRKKELAVLCISKDETI
jgi:hypothetical protein